MTTWIQSLSWTLIYSLGQGLGVYAILWLAFKLIPVRSPNARYHLSLSAMTVLLGWFATTWWQQYHLISADDQSINPVAGATSSIMLPLQQVSLSAGVSVQSLQTSLSALFPWICAFYVVGLSLMITRLSAGMLQLFSLRNSGTCEPETTINELFAEQKKRMQVNGAARLLVSAKAQVPMVIGFLKPIVLLPAAALTQLDPEQLKTILLHELAHIKRNDYLVNILQTIAETILFFNPFVWLLSRTARREREHCCDDLVVGNTTEPLFYATALATLASRRNAAPPMAVAASGQSTHLYDRIQRIMEAKKNQFSYSRMVAMLIILATITLSVAWIRPSFTGKKNKGTTTVKKQEASTPVRSYAAELNNEPRNIEENNAPKTNETAKGKTTATAKITEENILIDRLIEDKLIDQVKGFLVEKRDDKLFVNGEKLPENVANKYLSNLRKKAMWIQVFKLEDRLRMHPNADLLQLLLPYSMQSPCMDTKPKEGC